MRTKFSLILDSFVLFLCVGLLMFAWVKFYTKSVLLSLIVSILVATLILFITSTIYKKRTAKLNLKKEEKKQVDYLNLNLFFTPKAEVLQYFENALKQKYQVSKTMDCLILKGNTSQNDKHTTLHSTLFAPFYDKEKLDYSTLLHFYRIAKINNLDNIIICANDFDDDVKNIAKQIKNLTIKLLDTTQIYSTYLKAQPQLPQAVDITKKKLKQMELLRYAFSPARARHYLLFGLLLLLTSFLVPFKIYYLIFGSILCVTALFVKLYPILKKNR